MIGFIHAFQEASCPSCCSTAASTPIAGDQAGIDSRRPPGLERLRHLVRLTGYDLVHRKPRGLRPARALL
jgi:hypothetical protein